MSDDLADLPTHYHPMPHPLMLTDVGGGRLTNAEAFGLTTDWDKVTCPECLVGGDR